MQDTTQTEIEAGADPKHQTGMATNADVMEQYDVVFAQTTTPRWTQGSVTVSVAPALGEAVADPLAFEAVIYAKPDICRQHNAVIAKVVDEDLDGRSHPRARSIRTPKAGSALVAVPEAYLPLLGTTARTIQAADQDDLDAWQVLAGDGVIFLETRRANPKTLPDDAFDAE